MIGPQGHNVYIKPAAVDHPVFDHLDNHLLQVTTNQSQFISEKPVRFAVMQPGWGPKSRRLFTRGILLTGSVIVCRPGHTTARWLSSPFHESTICVISRHLQAPRVGVALLCCQKEYSRGTARRTIVDVWPRELLFGFLSAKFHSVFHFSRVLYLLICRDCLEIGLRT